MNSRPRLLLLIPHLGGGGAERVTALLARGLPVEKYEIHLGLITQAEAREELPPWVHTHGLGARRVSAGTFGLLGLVRRLKPDLILSGMAHLNFLVLLLRPFFPKGTRVLVRQNGSVSAALASGEVHSYTRLLYRLLYRHADRVLCQSRAMAEEIALLGIPEGRLAVLPNPVEVEKIRRSIAHAPARLTGAGSGFGPQLQAVGRLSTEKGFDLLLSALVLVRREYPEASLVIAGVGCEEQALKALCHSLGLDGAVDFAGYIQQPWTQFPETTLYVLPSRHEGLPNALLEAAAAGLPIVATPACAGLTELLRDRPGVWLASEITAEALAASLLAALRVLRPGERFDHPFVEDFRIDRAIRAYECLIDQCLIEKA
jgi:glycosyltransferase involved in cell wall biosynthesis